MNVTLANRSLMAGALGIPGGKHEADPSNSLSSRLAIVILLVSLPFSHLQSLLFRASDSAAALLIAATRASNFSLGSAPA